MPDSPTAIASTWSASAATPGSIQGAFTVSAATPGAIQGAFTVSAATPGPIEGLYRSTYASITIAPTGDTGNNQFLLTSLVPFTGGNAISFQMLAFAGSATTDVTVTDFAIVVTPGALARMTISGTTPSVATTVFLAADYTEFGGGCFTLPTGWQTTGEARAGPQSMTTEPHGICGTGTMGEISTILPQRYYRQHLRMD